MTAARSGHADAMRRFAPSQPDLFAPPPAPAPPPSPPERPPLDELNDLLALVRGAEKMPWPNLQETMAQEHRAMFLASKAGAEGAKLLTAIFNETERLFSAEEQAALRRVAAPLPE